MSRFLVQKEIEFDAGHRVPDHASKCFNPHGHRYRVVVGISGPLQTEGSENGMVVDFGAIKEKLTSEVHDVFDHGFIVHERDSAMLAALNTFDLHASKRSKTIVVPWVPTAENMAYAIFHHLYPLFLKTNEFGTSMVYLEYVQVYETPTSMAIFRRGDES